MSLQTLEMRNQRAQLVADARKILEAAEKEGRKMNGEEEAKWNKMMDDSAALKDRIDKAEKLEKEEKELDEAAKATKVDPSNDSEGRRDNPFASKEYRDAFESWSAYGAGVLRPDQAAVMLKAFNQTHQTDVNVTGGYTVVPEQLATGILKGVDDMVHIRQRATKISLSSAASLGVVSLDSDPDDGEWTEELGTGGTTGVGFGKRELRTHPMAKRIKLSNTLIEKSALNMEALLRQRMEYKIGITQEKAYLVGDGNNKPLGIMVPSDSGIPTSRDVVVGTATAITFDGMMDAKYALKAQYWPRATYGVHRDGVKMLAKLKDGDGQYIWRESVSENEPDRMLGRPLLISEYIPNTYTSGQYVGFFGDLTYYWILDALNIKIQRLVELYAASNETGYHFRYEGDGMPVLAEAFVRMKMGS